MPWFHCLSERIEHQYWIQILYAAEGAEDFARGGTLSKVFIMSYAVNPMATEGTTCIHQTCSY